MSRTAGKLQSMQGKKNRINQYKNLIYRRKDCEIYKWILAFEKGNGTCVCSRICKPQNRRQHFDRISSRQAYNRERRLLKYPNADTDSFQPHGRSDHGFGGTPCRSPV